MITQQPDDLMVGSMEMPSVAFNEKKYLTKTWHPKNDAIMYGIALRRSETQARIVESGASKEYQCVGEYFQEDLEGDLEEGFEDCDWAFNECSDVLDEGVGGGFGDRFA
jgi:hypothetical protein